MGNEKGACSAIFIRDIAKEAMRNALTSDSIVSKKNGTSQKGIRKNGEDPKRVVQIKNLKACMNQKRSFDFLKHIVDNVNDDNMKKKSKSSSKASGKQERMTNKGSKLSKGAAAKPVAKGNPLEPDDMFGGLISHAAYSEDISQSIDEDEDEYD